MNAGVIRHEIRPIDTRLPLAACAMGAMTLLGLSELEPWAVMSVVIVLLFVMFKALSWRPLNVPVRWRLAYAIGWVGMDMQSFTQPARPVATPAALRWMAALLWTLLGATLSGGVAPSLLEVSPWAAGWAMMIGFVLFLHFGLFHLLALLWQSLGADARPIMNRPLLATSVSAFWSRHWNLAYHDVTHRVLFQPAYRAWGMTAAVLVSFFVSGLVHELALSVPARAGFGGPTAYFMLQACATLLERSRWRVWLGPPTGWRWRLFTIAVVAGPAGLLFHPWFVERVALPLVAALGAN